MGIYALDEDELRQLSNAELNDRISAIATQNRTLVSLCDELRRNQEAKTREIESYDKQITRGIRLPYLVASVSEVCTFVKYHVIDYCSSCRR